MQENAFRREDVKRYYEIGPKIVDAITKSKKREQILINIYNELIVPCLEFIKNNEFESCYKKYKQYTIYLEEKLL